jgi:hypothetical protein
VQKGTTWIASRPHQPKPSGFFRRLVTSCLFPSRHLPLVASRKNLANHPFLFPIERRPSPSPACNHRPSHSMTLHPFPCLLLHILAINAIAAPNFGPILSMTSTEPPLQKFSESEAGGEAGDPYSRYFYSDIHGWHKKGGVSMHRWRKDIRGYTPEARDKYNRWRNGPANTYGKTWVHSCVSFPFCNHIPPPPAFTPGPWDIPALTPNPTYPTLHPFPKRMFGEDNFYGRDLYHYGMSGIPQYRKTDTFYKLRRR